MVVLALLTLLASSFSSSSLMCSKFALMPLSDFRFSRSFFIVGDRKPSSAENLGDIRPPERRFAPPNFGERSEEHFGDSSDELMFMFVFSCDNGLRISLASESDREALVGLMSTGRAVNFVCVALC